MTRTLVAACLLATACPARAPVPPRATAHEEQRLAEAASRHWNALRWGDVETAAAAFETPEQRLRYLERWSVDPPRKVVDVAVMDVAVSEPLPTGDRPRQRTGTVTVRVEGYALPAGNLEVTLVVEDWYRTATGWWRSTE